MTENRWVDMLQPHLVSHDKEFQLEVEVMVEHQQKMNWLLVHHQQQKYPGAEAISAHFLRV